MSTTIAVDEVQSRLKDLIANLGPDDEIVITQNNRPVARLVPSRNSRATFGNCKGMLTVVEEDDEHLAEFEDYMP